jgi:hypothetical protein
MSTRGTTQSKALYQSGLSLRPRQGIVSMIDEVFSVTIEKWSGRLFRALAAGFVLYWAVFIVLQSRGPVVDPRDQADAARYTDGPNIEADAK